MRPNYHISLWVATFVILLLSGCSDEYTSGVSVSDGKYHSQLLFNVTQAVTRADSGEDDVRRVDLLIFKAGKLEKKLLNITSFDTSPEGYASVDISMDTEGPRKVYVVANGDNTSWLEALEIDRTTTEDMLAFRTSVLEEMPASPFVMYGISDDIVFGTMQTSVLCPLYRAVARIDIQNKSEKFVPLSAKLIRAMSSSVIFSGGPFVESGSKDFESIEAKDGTIRLYTYENASTDSLKATAVEITGDVNGIPLTYTVFLAQEKKLIPLQRNYRYSILVNEVKANTLVTTMDVRPWLVGDDINATVSGDRPIVSVDISPSTGIYTEADSTFVIEETGGLIRFDVKSNAECDIILTGGWLEKVAETRASSIDGSFTVEAKVNMEASARTGEILIFNRISGSARTFTLTQKEASSQENRYMVLVVAGQSNASGYDVSVAGPEDVVHPDIFQLSYGRGNIPNMSIIPLTFDAEDIDDATNGYGRNYKGIHLPLAKELLKRLPSGTKILVVPVSCSATGFKAGRPYGTYDHKEMKPVITAKVLYRWGVESSYCKTLLDRLKYALDLNTANKFLGFVWCQGEHDRFNADHHYTEFIKMTDHIFTEMNSGGYGARTNYGTFDKRLWYTYSSTRGFMDWYGGKDASVVFSSYKQWNPDGFVHVPYGVPVNPTALGGGDAHFGQNTFRKIIAPAVAECMEENGALPNGSYATGKRFLPAMTPADANKYGGTLDDEDIKSSLITYFPFTTSTTPESGRARVVSSSGISMVSVSGLTDINGKEMSRQAAQFGRDSHISLRNSASGNKWSFSFMLKRTGGMDENIQTVLGNSGLASTPFVGFKYYADVQHCAGITEFVTEPSYQNKKLKAVPGLLLNADQVRSLHDWIHYVVTYDGSKCIVYMNGEEVQNATFSNAPASLSNLILGNNGSSFPGFEGQLMEFFAWDKVLAPATVKKLFLMGYYGFSR